MALTLASIALPDLAWEDEFDWTPVAQGTTRTEDGTLIIEESALLKGQPITLVGSDSEAWARRSSVVSLLALQQSASASPMTLTLPDARTFTVVWRRDGNTPPMTARPIRAGIHDPNDAEWYSVTLRLLTV
jgi:hypothetical protein